MNWQKPPKSPQTARAPISLKTRALRLLARRDYGEAQLTRQLSPFVEAGDDLAALIVWLKTAGFLDESRFIDAATRARAPRMGARRIGSFLRAQGVSGDQVAAAMETLRDSEGQRAHALWLRKFGGEKPTDVKERARQTRFLLARGFDGDVVRKVLNGYFADE